MAIHANSTPVPTRPLLRDAPRACLRPYTTNYRRVSAALKALLDDGFVMGCNIDATWTHSDGRTASFCHEGCGAFVTVWPAERIEPVLGKAIPVDPYFGAVRLFDDHAEEADVVLPLSGLAQSAPGVLLFKKEGRRDA